MDPKKTAQEILDAVGGKDNIKDVSHCFTRLRLVLKDNSKADQDVVSHTEGVIQVVEAGGQFQVVLGAKVTKVYDEFLPLVGIAGSGEVPADDAPTVSDGNESLGNRILQTVSKMFTPLIPAIAAGGLIKGLLTAANLIAKQQGMDISTSDTYVLLYAASQVIFYFMPIFLGYTAAKALKCNEIIAMILGGFLCYPAVDKFERIATDFPKAAECAKEINAYLIREFDWCCSNEELLYLVLHTNRFISGQ